MGDQEGRVFKSRGSLIRHLHANRLKKREQLEVLKRMLKVNQTKHFEELRRNDKFIKHMEVDENYLLFIKVRYDNHHDIPETVDSTLPSMWKKKVNGVEYFKDPTGQHVFNSRRLAVEFLRKTRYDLSDDTLVKILEESEDESDLSDSEEDSETETERSGSRLLEELNQVMDEVDEENDRERSLEEQVLIEC